MNRRKITRFLAYRDYIRHCIGWADFLAGMARRYPDKESSYRPIETTTLRFYKKLLNQGGESI